MALTTLDIEVGNPANPDLTESEERDGQLVGALTLAGLGLMLDPLRRELRPLPMVLS